MLKLQVNPYVGTSLGLSSLLTLPFHLKQEITQKLNVKYNKRKDKYLGLPFLLGHKKADLFDDVVNKVCNKINKWYNRFLSQASRALLIQTVSNTIPSFTMSTTQIHVSCTVRINSLNKKFLWNPSTGTKKSHDLGWNKDCTDKKLGGLGIRNLDDLNIAYQFKILWRLISSPNSI